MSVITICGVTFGYSGKADWYRIWSVEKQLEERGNKFKKTRINPPFSRLFAVFLFVLASFPLAHSY